MLTKILIVSLEIINLYNQNLLISICLCSVKPIIGIYLTELSLKLFHCP